MGMANTQVCEYGGKILEPLDTFADENCFFHSIYGKKVKGSYYDDEAEYRRLWWLGFLKHFQSRSKPLCLEKQLEKCIAARNKCDLLSTDKSQQYIMYINNVLHSKSVILIDEIPILSALENKKVILFIKGNEIPRIFEPDITILENYKQKNRNLFEACIYFDESHFSKMKLVVGITHEILTTNNIQPEKKLNAEIKNQLSSPESKKYYKKIGSAGMEGGLYQINLLTIFLLNGLERSVNFQLSTENEKAGKFDDVVFEFGPKKAAILLQAKHKQGKKRKVTYEDLFSTNSKNDHFSLPKYFVSYLEVKKNFDIQNVILCTNTGLKLDEKLTTLLIKKKLSVHSLLYFENADEMVYKFKNKIIPEFKKSVFKYCEENLQRKDIDKSLICNGNITEFFNRLQIIADYPAKTNLDQIIENTISQMIMSKNLDSKAVSKYIHKKMEDWFKEEKGRFLTQFDAINLFCEMRSNKYCDMLDNTNIYFKQDKPVFNSNKKVLHFVYNKEYILNLIRILRTFQRNSNSSLFVNPNEETTIQKQIIEAFQSSRYENLVIILANNTIELTKKLCRKIVNDLKHSTYKKLIILTNEEDELISLLNIDKNIYETIQDSIKFSDFTKETQDNLLNTKYVNFQNKNMHLGDVVTERSEEALNQIIEIKILVKLIKSDPIQIGSDLKQLDKNIQKCYICRQFTRGIEKPVSEEDFCQLDEINREKIVLICDTAGMGKSTVLTSLSHKIKEKHPYLWLVRIDLNSCTKVLNEYLNKNLDFISIEELLNSQDSTRFKSCFEKNVFLMRGKVILMLDGIDEISPKYTHLVESLLEDCLKRYNIRKIFVTSRPHVQNSIEKLLNIRSFVLQPFDRCDQVNFLTAYWTEQLDVHNIEEKNKCEISAKEFLDSVVYPKIERSESAGKLFSGVPLHMSMLGEIFQGGNPKYEGFKEFIDSTLDKPEFPMKLNLAKIYEIFVNKKEYIYINEKGNACGNTIISEALEKEIKVAELYHHYLALKLVLGKEQLKFFTEITNPSKTVPEKTLTELGIMHKVNGEMIFIHRTFAEYFVAKCIIIKLTELVSDRTKFGIFFQGVFAEGILSKKGFRNVRHFIDDLLDLHLLPISCRFFIRARFYFVILLLAEEGCLKIFKLICGGRRLDSFIYSKILQIASVEGHLSIVRYLIEKFGISTFTENYLLHAAVPHLKLTKYLVDRGADVNTENNKGETPLFKAAILGNTEVIDFLIERSANINATDKTGQTALYHSTYMNNVKTVEYLIEKGMDINNTDRNGVTIFHVAAVYGLIEIAKFLLCRGVDVNVIDASGSTVLHHAVKNGNLGFVKCLVTESNINVDTRNKNGKTALHLGVEEGYFDLVDYLIGQGASVEILDNSGRKALEWPLYENENMIGRDCITVPFCPPDNLKEVITEKYSKYFEDSEVTYGDLYDSGMRGFDFEDSILSASSSKYSRIVIEICEDSDEDF